MLLSNFEITDVDINYAEKILFKGTKVFSIDKDDSKDVVAQKTERLDFIRNLNTLDLEAVPGSGKTTALLVKLIIMEKNLPLKNGRGVAILSHTNAAVDEIKEKIGSFCPKLFSYPNFVGTIQSFINRFFAIPFLRSEFKIKDIRIDDDLYMSKVRYYSQGLGNGAKNFIRMNNINLEDLRFDFEFNLCKSDGKIVLRKGSSKSYLDISALKDKILRIDGVISYSEAYFYALIYLNEYPEILKFLMDRFEFAFVDEMQDVDENQRDILEKVFFNSKCIYQRLGDENQAIYTNEVTSGGSREINLKFSCSHRLSEKNSKMVSRFQYKFCSNINGLYCSNIKPHLIVFDDDKIGEVIPKYKNIINELNKFGHLPNFQKYNSYVVAWVVDKSADLTDYKRLTMQHYLPDFERANNSIKLHSNSLVDCINSSKKSKNYGGIYKNLITALLHILWLEGIKDSNNKQYTVSSIKNFFGVDEEKLNLQLYEISHLCLLEAFDDAYQKAKSLIETLLTPRLSTRSLSPKSLIFVDQSVPSPSTLNSVIVKQRDFLKYDTIHGVKGQTHCATLYLETFFMSGHDSERLADLISGHKNKFDELKKKNQKIHIQNCKLMYVGLSRATDLLAIAIHKDRYSSLIQPYINQVDFEVVDLTI